MLGFDFELGVHACGDMLSTHSDIAVAAHVFPARILDVDQMRQSHSGFFYQVKTDFRNYFSHVLLHSVVVKFRADLRFAVRIRLAHL